MSSFFAILAAAAGRLPFAYSLGAVLSFGQIVIGGVLLAKRPAAAFASLMITCSGSVGIWMCTAGMLDTDSLGLPPNVALPLLILVGSPVLYVFVFGVLFGGSITSESSTPVAQQPEKSQPQAPAVDDRVSHQGYLRWASNAGTTQHRQAVPLSVDEGVALLRQVRGLDKEEDRTVVIRDAGATNGAQRRQVHPLAAR